MSRKRLNDGRRRCTVCNRLLKNNETEKCEKCKKHQEDYSKWSDIIINGGKNIK